MLRNIEIVLTPLIQITLEILISRRVGDFGPFVSFGQPINTQRLNAFGSTYICMWTGINKVH